VNLGEVKYPYHPVFDDPKGRGGGGAYTDSQIEKEKKEKLQEQETKHNHNNHNHKNNQKKNKKGEDDGSSVPMDVLKARLENAEDWTECESMLPNFVKAVRETDGKPALYNSPKMKPERGYVGSTGGSDQGSLEGSISGGGFVGVGGPFGGGETNTATAANAAAIALLTGEDFASLDAESLYSPYEHEGQAPDTCEELLSPANRPFYNPSERGEREKGEMERLQGGMLQNGQGQGGAGSCVTDIYAFYSKDPPRIAKKISNRYHNMVLYEFSLLL
jgi:hypothetical protein